MANDEITRWFASIFRGKWMELPTNEPVPRTSQEDSQNWAALLLADPLNPYQRGEHPQLFLGLGLSPDKMVTRIEDEQTENQLTIFETLQQYVVTRASLDPQTATAQTQDAALLEIQATFLPLFSSAARSVVAATIVSALPQAKVVELAGDQPILLSAPVAPLTTIEFWSDQINLIWFEHKLFVVFYKTYRGSAVAIFRPGLDWFPSEMRDKHGVARRK